MRLGRVLYTCRIFTLRGVGGVTLRVPFSCSSAPLIKYIVKHITLNKTQQLVLAGHTLVLDRPVSRILDKCISVIVDKGVTASRFWCAVMW